MKLSSTCIFACEFQEKYGVAKNYSSIKEMFEEESNNVVNEELSFLTLNSEVDIKRFHQEKDSDKLYDLILIDDSGISAYSQMDWADVKETLEDKHYKRIVIFHTDDRVEYADIVREYTGFCMADISFNSQSATLCGTIVIDINNNNSKLYKAVSKSLGRDISADRCIFKIFVWGSDMELAYRNSRGVYNSLLKLTDVEKAEVNNFLQRCYA